jgi:hypothetical protein
LLTYALLAPGTAPAANLSLLKALYIGDAGSRRSQEFEAFLKLNLAKVAVANRRGFQPSQAAEFDVVLLDWPQPAGEGWEKRCPLGDREAWTKPTVLLGSATLHVAVRWKGKGGAG